jgi:hypothetical protein
MALMIETRLPRLLGRLPRALEPLGERARKRVQGQIDPCLINEY